MDRVAAAVASYKKQDPPVFDIGDTVDVQVRIKEGERERIQLFSGVVIAFRGEGICRCFTVRRIVQSEGVERVFPIHSPFVVGVTVRKRAKVRRAKLYYLRDRKGKSARMKERLDYSKKKVKKPGAPTAEPTGELATADH
jgi:large subunit ribosomal protein L19